MSLPEETNMARKAALRRTGMARLAQRRSVHRVTYLQHATVEASDGQSLLEVSIRNRIPHHHQCGAKARCTTCRVQILDGIGNVSTRCPLEESIARHRGWDPCTRLACQTKIHGDVVVRRPLGDPQRIIVLDLEEMGRAAAAEGSELDVAVLF